MKDYCQLQGFGLVYEIQGNAFLINYMNKTQLQG